MSKIIDGITFLFFVFLSVVLIENYAIEHKQNEIIYVDTCKNDTVIIDTCIKN